MRDHPRSRGVYVHNTRLPAPTEGSSPLARGLRTRKSRPGRQIRIIPARAGFTQQWNHALTDGEDHPRSRGVYAPVHGVGAGARWIIPARAGFTFDVEIIRGSQSDHPRSRGVYTATPIVLKPELGSSPLARGLRFVAGDGPLGPRIIPARAGFTWIWGRIM